VVDAVAALAAGDIREAYLKHTPGSAALIDRAARVLPAGSSRSFSYFHPYPVVFDHGEGPLLWDVDGNRYIDFVNNGLSLIHGNAYPPIVEAVAEIMPLGTAWPGTSTKQIEFAELLCRRVGIADQVRFANTGTEATMLAVKLARYVTGRQLVLKAWHGYHGFYDDLSAGLEGQGEIPGRVLLAEFGDASGFAAKLAEHGDQIAAVILEPVPYTGRVTPPPEGFLNAVQDLARAAGALFVIDDCLMFRLAPGGSPQKFDLEPDMVCLGKWIGGGFPVGAIAAGADLMRAFDERRDNVLMHGGSFNGNPIGSVAGRIAVEHLTETQINSMDQLAAKLVEGLEERATARGVPLAVRGVGSAFGVYVLGPDENPDAALTSQLQLAALVNGVYLGPEGELSMSTPMADELVEEALEGLDGALTRVAPLVTSLEGA
jgi:glutamate-1-semialdehyde 2,1-aminomutase